MAWFPHSAVTSAAACAAATKSSTTGEVRDAGAQVVKAFNTVFRGVLEHGAPHVFVAGDDAPAKVEVAAFVDSLGMRPLDVGGLAMAHWLERMGLVSVGLAGHGVAHGDFALGVDEFAD